VFDVDEIGHDLLNFVDYNGVDVENGNIPLYELKGTGNVILEPEAEEIESEKTESKTDSSVFIIVVIAALVIAGYYLLKMKKQKKEIDEAEEIEAFDVPDDEEVGGTTEYVDGEEDEN